MSPEKSNETAVDPDATRPTADKSCTSTADVGNTTVCQEQWRQAMTKTLLPL
jgi:hypothetical protein